MLFSAGRKGGRYGNAAAAGEGVGGERRREEEEGCGSRRRCHREPWHPRLPHLLPSPAPSHLPVSSPFLNALLGMLYVHLATRSSLTSATAAPFPVYNRSYMVEDVTESIKVDRGPQLHIQLGPTVLVGEDGELVTC